MAASEMDLFDDDPMAKDFNSIEFNSYSRGPGSHIDPGLHTHKGWEKKQEAFCLYVTNLPVGINRNGLLNLFGNFGEPLRVSINTSRNNEYRYAHVDFRTLYEAQKAVMNLHNCAPLYLIVKFAMKNQPKQTRNELVDDTLDTLTHVSHSELQSSPQSVETQEEGSLMGMKPKDMVSLFRRTTPYLVSTGHSWRRGFFNLPLVDDVLLAYHQAINYMKPVITSDGLFLLDLGKRISLTNIHVKDAYSLPTVKVKSFFNEDGVEVSVGSKECCVCGEKAARICFNCHSYFCSKLCFRLDQPNHTLHSNGSVFCHNVDGSEGKTDGEQCAGVEVNKLILAPLESCSVSNAKSRRAKINQISSCYRYSHLIKSHYINKSTLSPQGDEVKIKKAGQGSVRLEKETTRQQLDSCPISSQPYTQVVVSHIVSHHHYFVNLLSQRSQKLQLKQLLKTSKNETTVQKVVVGECYATLLSNQWERVKVSCVEPLCLFYIDSGKEENFLDKSRTLVLKHLPPSASLHKYPPQALRIRMVDTTDSQLLGNIKVTTRLSIKLLHKEEERFVVVAEGDEEPNIVSTAPSTKPTDLEKLKHVCFSMGVDCKEFEVTVNSITSDYGATGSVVLNPSHQHYSLTDISSQLLTDDTNKNNEKVEVGGLVMCEVEGLKGRGYVMSTVEQVVRVALVDHGLVISCPRENCHTLPSSLLHIPHLSVSCHFSHHIKHISVGTKLLCRDAQVVDGRVKCKVEGYGECELSAWIPRVEDGGLSSVKIECGTKVVISSFHSSKALYVRSIENPLHHQFQSFLQDLAAYAVTAPSLMRQPEKEELVLCLSLDDNNYYRAQVVGRKDKRFSVIFVDFGSLHEVELHQMKLLCDSLKMVNCFALKISLKGVAEEVLTPDAVSFLNVKCSNDEAFFLEYESADACTLISTEGVNLNSKISEMIDPAWKRCLAASQHPTNDEVFFGSDVTYSEWETNSEMKVLIVKKASVNCYLVINLEDGLLEFMVNWMTPRLSQYCRSFPEEYQYTPRMGELCLVNMKDSDDWFRAICLETHQHFGWVVLIDFGNYGPVIYRRVRPLPNDFIQQPSILKKCFIEGLPDVLPSEECEKRLDRMLALGSVHQIVPLEEIIKGVVKAYFKVVSENAENLGLPPISSVFSQEEAFRTHCA